jgi:2-methylisocitrate lyase-like PEP mutase family enzyme
MAATQRSKAEAFRALHHEGCYVMPNPWDAGSARLLAGMGFAALAHARAIVQATELPVAADLENGFGDASEDAALTIRRAAEGGLVLIGRAESHLQSPQCTGIRVPLSDACRETGIAAVRSS